MCMLQCLGDMVSECIDLHVSMCPSEDFGFVSPAMSVLPIASQIKAAVAWQP